jgi:hypothetical protein
MIPKSLLKISLVAIIAALGTTVLAQMPGTRPSPSAFSNLKFEDNYVKVTYCQPQKKGRDVFGGLVPYGAVWRTGANEATEITVTKDLKMGGKSIKAGTYALFAIPNKDQWTIILNTELGQWGAYSHKAEKDLVRFDVPAKTTDQTVEAFTIKFGEKTKQTEMILQWDMTQVSIPIEFM